MGKSIFIICTLIVLRIFGCIQSNQSITEPQKRTIWSAPSERVAKIEGSHEKSLEVAIYIPEGGIELNEDALLALCSNVTYRFNTGERPILIIFHPKEDYFIEIYTSS